jgi:hypothetical protein
LDGALSDAAKADGHTTFVDTYGPSLGHDACAANGAAWVQGKDVNLLAAISYHPLKAGMIGEASLIQKALTGQQSAVTTQTPKSTAGLSVENPLKAGELAATTGVSRG